MINRIFFITENMVPANQQYAGDNIYFSILVNPAADDSLQNAYKYVAASSSACLTISIYELLTPESIRFITSFLFIPSYLKLEGRPVVNLEGSSTELLESDLSNCK